MCMYRNLGEPELPNIAKNELVYTHSLKHNNFDFHFNYGVTNIIRSPMRITPAQSDPIEYEMHEPGYPNAMMMNDRIVSYTPTKIMSISNWPGLISPANLNNASLFFPLQEDYSAYKQDVQQSHFQFVGRHAEFFPKNASNSMGYASSIANARGKLTKMGRNSLSQQYRQRCSTDNNFYGFSNKQSLTGIHTLPRKFHVFGHEAQRNCNVWESKLSRNVAGVNKVGSYNINSIVKSKKRDRKRLVQSFHGVLCSDEQDNIANEKDKKKQNYNEEMDTVATLIHPESEHGGSFVRFQGPSFDRDRSNQRYNPDRWAIVSAFCNSLENMCRQNRPAGEASKKWGNTRLNSTNVSYIPLSGYLKRVAWLFECSKECFVIALEYIHQLARVAPDVRVNYTTVHQLIVAALRVSQKFVDDNFIRSSYYAYIVDLPVSTISVFEAQLVFFLKFDLNVPPDQYYERYSRMLADNRGLSKVTIWPGGN